MDPLKYMCEMRQDRGGIVQTPVSVRIWCLPLLMLIVAAESPSIVLQYKTYYVYLAWCAHVSCTLPTVLGEFP